MTTVMEVIPPAYDEPEPLFVDVAAFLDGSAPEPPQPVLLTRQDGQRLFYAAKVNVLYGDPECGKTWIAYAAVVEALNAGLRALILDVDHNGTQEVLHRLGALGADLDALRDPERFRLAEPEDDQALLGVIQQAVLWRPAVAVVDSIGEVMPILGLNSNLPDDYTSANRRTLGALAKAGAAVIGIDHMSKGAQSRQQGQGGANAKRRAVNGLSLRVTLAQPFAPGGIGQAYLRIDKDRPGAVRAACPRTRSQPAGTFHLDGTRPAIAWWITNPTDDDAEVIAQAEGESDHGAPRATRRGEPWRVTDADVADLDALADRLGKQPSVRDARKELRWGDDRAQATVRTWKALRGQEVHP